MMKRFVTQFWLELCVSLGLVILAIPFLLMGLWRSADGLEISKVLAGLIALGVIWLVQKRRARADGDGK